jgi:hypothetical protein
MSIVINHRDWWERRVFAAGVSSGDVSLISRRDDSGRIRK